MKRPLTHVKCMDKECDYRMNTHRLVDGISCPDCGGPTWTIPLSEYVGTFVSNDDDLPTRLEGSE